MIWRGVRRKADRFDAAGMASLFETAGTTMDDRRALAEKVGRDLRYDPEKNVYFFKALRGRPTRAFEHRNLHATARRTMVTAYASKRDEARLAHWRHAVFGVAFLRLEHNQNVLAQVADVGARI